MTLVLTFYPHPLSYTVIIITKLRAGHRLGVLMGAHRARIWWHYLSIPYYNNIITRDYNNFKPRLSLTNNVRVKLPDMDHNNYGKINAGSIRFSCSSYRERLGYRIDFHAGFVDFECISVPHRLLMGHYADSGAWNRFQDR